MPGTARPIRLSKSRIQSGRQCPKRLWLEMHQRDAVQWAGAAQFRMDEGTRFGELAQELLGGGVLIEADYRHPQQALADTRRELACPLEEVPMLFEAAFEHENVMVRVDGFHRRHDGDTLIEVKSSTSVKDEYLWDCAIQTWVARGEIGVGGSDLGQRCRARHGNRVGLVTLFQEALPFSLPDPKLLRNIVTG